MNYKIFDTIERARQYSEDAGKEAGLAYHTGTGTTRYMYSFIQHPDDGRGACMCPNGTVTREELELDGWFGETEEI